MRTAPTTAVLEENRRGRLHETQRARGVARAERQLRLALVLQVLGAVSLLAPQALHVFPRLLKDFTFELAPLEVRPAAAVAFFVFGLVLGGLPLLFGFTTRREGLRARRAFQAGRVELIEDVVRPGPVRRVGQQPRRCLAGGRLLSLGEVAWREVDSTRRSKVYVLAGLDLVLAVE